MPKVKMYGIILKKFLETHISKLCLWRSETCPCCALTHRKYQGTTVAGGNLWERLNHSLFGTPLTYHEIVTDHHCECPNWPTRCPNSCNPYLTLRRSAVDSHVKEKCPETVLDCKFAAVGCRVRVKRKDLAQHMHEAMSDHMTALFEDHIKLKQKNVQLETELNRLKSQRK